MDSYLAHYGVLGMKWGVRRYQPYPKGSKGVYAGPKKQKNPKEIKNPIPLASFDSMLKVLYDSYEKDSWKHAKKKNIPISSVKTFQSKVFSDKIKSMTSRNDPDKIQDSGADIKGILIARVNNEYVIVDGNHRVAASKINNKKHIDAYVYSVDNDIFKKSLVVDPDALKKGKKYVDDWLKNS